MTLVSNDDFPKFNDGFYTVDLRVVILSDNDPLAWDYMALFDAIKKQYQAGDYALQVKKVD